MLDKTLPYVGVLMTKSDTHKYPQCNLPEGYTFSTYQPGYEKDWGKIHYQLGQTKTVSEAVKIFENEFLIDFDTATKQCFFVLDSQSKVVATASLWYGDTFGKTNHRIHWVAVHPDHHGKGLAKALLTKIMTLHNQLGHKGILYLVTQTWSYKAINLYGKFGFIPFKGMKPVNWHYDDYETKNDAAWDVILQKISEYKSETV